MARKVQRKKRPRRIPLNLDCNFCKGSSIPDYKEYRELIKYLSERGRIIGKKGSGVCSRHQRMLSREIKRARHLGLLPFAPSV